MFMLVSMYQSYDGITREPRETKQASDQLPEAGHQAPFVKLHASSHVKLR